MDEILLAQPGWQDRVADALRRAPRPIPVDERLMPRREAAESAAPLPRYERSAMPPARPAATLLLLYPGPDGELRLPLTVRHASLRAHAGEVSLPGGAVEEADPSHEATALREAEEEIGVAGDGVAVLGTLDDVWIPVTNFRLRPFVGALPARPEMAPQTDEVALIVELPLRDLLHEGAVTDEIVHGPGWTLRVGGYRAEGQLVWGATARTLAMLASVLAHA
ncbi:MAG TPA: CoA pyrophosphatase [Candidatus Limnocylindria bacterium]|nr:CoA pyrophosphatase [Candidatus Limnocylindria bacterium]